VLSWVEASAAQRAFARVSGKGTPVIHIVLLLGCAAVIYLACEWFVNSVEWLGVEFKVGALAVGTILAAAGTALH
jgi:Ca2+/Na+ antiporter